MSTNLGECETELYFPANELFFFNFELSSCYIMTMISVSSGPGCLFWGQMKVRKWAPLVFSYHHAGPSSICCEVLFPLSFKTWFLGVTSANFSFDLKGSRGLVLRQSPSCRNGAVGNVGSTLGSNISPCHSGALRTSPGTRHPMALCDLWEPYEEAVLDLLV